MDDCKHEHLKCQSCMRDVVVSPELLHMPSGPALARIKELENEVQLTEAHNDYLADKVARFNGLMAYIQTFLEEEKEYDPPL